MPNLVGPLRYAATRVGAYTPASAIYVLNGMLNHLETGRWLRAHGFSTGPRPLAREALFERVARELRAEQPLYLEFGVFRGESLRAWARLLPAGARLVGFDSFEGLPLRWNEQF